MRLATGFWGVRAISIFQKQEERILAFSVKAIKLESVICLCTFTSIHSRVHSKELLPAAYFDFRRQADKNKTKKILKIKPQVQSKPTQQCFL